MKIVFGGILAFILLSPFSLFSQTAKDLFNQTTQPIYWLGVDYSHVRIIGQFSQFGGAGEKDISQLKDQYFPAWNNLILSEPEKYDIKGMFRKNEIINDLEMMMAHNQEADLSKMEVYNAPKYTKDDIKSFVSEYPDQNKTGIGILFVAETMDKNGDVAYYHIVAIDMSNKMILLSERMSGQPGGFGLKNYWGASIYNIIKGVKKSYYKIWKTTYGN